MKSSLKKGRGFAIILAALLLFQSCQIYHRQTVSQSEVIDAQHPTKVVYKNGQTAVFKEIVERDGILYGVQKGIHPASKPGFILEKGQTLIPIDRENIAALHLKDKSKSNTWTFVTVGATVGLIFLIVVVSEMSSCCASGWASSN